MYLNFSVDSLRSQQARALTHFLRCKWNSRVSSTGASWPMCAEQGDGRPRNSDWIQPLPEPYLAQSVAYLGRDSGGLGQPTYRRFVPMSETIEADAGAQIIGGDEIDHQKNLARAIRRGKRKTPYISLRSIVKQRFRL